MICTQRKEQASRQQLFVAWYNRVVCEPVKTGLDFDDTASNNDLL